MQARYRGCDGHQHAGLALGAWPERWLDGLAERHLLQTLAGLAAAGLLAGAWGAALGAF